MIIELEEYKYKLIGMRKDIAELRDSLRIDELTKQVNEMEEKTLDPDFWSDQTNSSKILQSIKQGKKKLDEFNGLAQRLEDAIALADMAIEENEEGYAEEVKAELEFVEREEERMRIEILLSGQYDRNNAIVSFHPGAGGTEAQDWAQMLYRLYTRWAERHGYQYDILDYQDGDEAGIK
ncbi:MAG: PCRF domain-containing protein, partial [Clostridia bacterium]|nr:PCRF domain-containing protein [Clostridia bacterium]